jgi:predicted metalloprotease with PDZ domain
VLFRPRALLAVAALAMVTGAGPHAAAPVRYEFAFPEPQHHWMQVAATFPDLSTAPLEVRMSRSSPGRYAIHDFAKNVYDLHAYAPDGRELVTLRTDDSGWRVPSHGDTVVVKYKVYGDQVDGTYLGVDVSHAHINMPAVIVWARGLDDRPATVVFDTPAGRSWQVATQLHPGSTPTEFSAPNLQYLMDSPAEFGPLTIEPFTVGPRRFRFAVHHTGTEAEVRGLVRDVQKIVAQEEAVYGEFPVYEPGTYTFIADYLPYALPDGMEHRDSTVMTSRGSIASTRFDLLDTVAHEFFHSWNVERIRPRDLEPFDFDRANVSSDLWLAEGFTQYYGPLALNRAGLMSMGATTAMLSNLLDTVITGPGRAFRSAEGMSRLAVFSDGLQPADRTDWSIAFTSYYPLGGALALALDLSLRERSMGRVSLDDFMREMWVRYGKPGGAPEGYVARPYTTDDAETVLAAVVRDPAFARDFFDRYVRGRELPDFARLLAPAGFLVRPAAPGGAWLGDVRLGAGDRGVAVANLVAPTWPLYAAGIDQDDEIEQLDKVRVASAEDVRNVLRRHRPGDRLEIVFVNRAGRVKTASVTLADNPHVDVVTVESTGAGLTPEQRTFRARWLGPK